MATIPEFDMFQDIWNFLKKYHDIEDTEEYWEKVVKESAAICAKHNNYSEYCSQIIMATVEELERRAKGARL